MAINLTNTLTRKKEEFQPIHKGKALMYSCGPTVYWTASIGNFRTMIMSDLLRRVLEFTGYEVRHVMNITDVGHLTSDSDEGEDKMIVAMKREGKTAWEIADFYTDQFIRDMERLNIKKPAVMPRATDHIDIQIYLIKTLEEKGYTYKTSDGIYFDTSKLDDYGMLSGQKLSEKEEGARVEKNPEKKSPSDFALWKFSREGVQREMEWESPWGKGFPGWHIECSAMSEKYLDVPFDIHTGGIDLVPVHHENEIAQTKAARGELIANYWVHGEYLLIDGGKMSKSLGNVYLIDDLAKKNFDPLSYRYFTYSAHYRTLLNFTWEALEAAQNALFNLYDIARELPKPSEPDPGSVDKFRARLEDDIDMPGAVALMWSVVNDNDLDDSIKAATLLKFDEVLGLRLVDYVSKPLKVPNSVKKLLDDRAKAREMKDWARSDELRNEIFDAGFIVEDTEDGQRLRERRS